MEQIKRTLWGPPSFTLRQSWIALVICSVYIAFLPSRGYINIISVHQNTDYTSNYFIQWSISYLIGCVINAFIIDKIGGKISLIIYGLMLTMSIFGLAIIDTLDEYDDRIKYVIIGCNGYSSSGIFPSIAKLIYTYFGAAQYDVLFIMIALCAHFTSLMTIFGVDRLSQSQTNTNYLYNTGYILIFAIIIIIVISLLLRRDDDQKWYLSPLSVWDHALKKYDEDFVPKQVSLRMNIEDNNYNITKVQHQQHQVSDISDVELRMDDIEKDEAKNKEEKAENNDNHHDITHTGDIDDLDKDEQDLQIKTLKFEIERLMKIKPRIKHVLNMSFMKTYWFLVMAFSCLSIMNCLNIFSYKLTNDALDTINRYYYHNGDKYDLGQLDSVPLMIQIGIICSLSVALFYRYSASKDAVYGDFQCSSVLLKLMVILISILCFFIWCIQIWDIVHPGTTPMCLYLFDFIFILFGICIAYPIHVYCYVFLLKICDQSNIGFWTSFTDLFLFTISVGFTIIAQSMDNQWLVTLLLLFAFGTNYFYHKLSTHSTFVQMDQQSKLLTIMTKFDLVNKPKYVINPDYVSSGDETQTEDSSYDDQTDELYSQILLHFKHISIQVKALRQAQHLKSQNSFTNIGYSSKERVVAISKSYDQLIKLLRELKQLNIKWYTNLKQNYELVPYVKQITKLEKMNEFQKLYKRKQSYFVRWINALN